MKYAALCSEILCRLPGLMAVSRPFGAAVRRASANLHGIADPSRRFSGGNAPRLAGTATAGAHPAGEAAKG
jgi:hypothetical protein